MNNSNNVQYKKKYVAFIDILGYSNLSLDPQNGEEVIKILATTQSLDEEVHKVFYKQGVDCTNEVITTFADSVYMSYPEGKGQAMINDIITLQRNIAWRGYFFRGGIVYDDIYDKRPFFFGPAQIKAYEIESKKAIYPRIVMDDNCFDHIRLELNKNCRITNDPKDGCYFVDFLGDYNGYGLHIEDIDASINKNLNKNFASGVNNKYVWLREYYDRCEKNWTFSKNITVEKFL